MDARRFSFRAALHAPFKNSESPLAAEIVQTIKASRDNVLSPNASSSHPKEALDARVHLRSELEKLYWQGVRLDLEAVISTLVAWESPDLVDSLPPSCDEEDTFVHGFDNFIDNVSHEGRKLAARAARWKDEESSPAHAGDYRGALERSAEDIRRSCKLEKIKATVREDAEAQLFLTKKDRLSKRRARLLLRGLGLLDIDKVLHQPEDTTGPEQTAATANETVPQLELDFISKRTGLPAVRSMACSGCGSIIRGSSYHLGTEKDNVEKAHGPKMRPFRLCEACYYYVSPEHQTLLTKRYKSTIITKDLATAQSCEKLCKCPRRVEYTPVIPGVKFERLPSNIFPIEDYSWHYGASPHSRDPRLGSGKEKCGLMELPMIVARASKQGLSLGEGHVGEEEPDPPSATARLMRKLHIQRSDSSLKPQLRTNPKTGMSEEACLQGTMAIRFGPLVIEFGNGTSSNGNSVHISLRNDLSLQVRSRSPQSVAHTAQARLEVTCDEDDGACRLSCQSGPQTRQPPIKCCLKQIVGSLFSRGDDQLEDKVLEEVLQLAQEVASSDMNDEMEAFRTRAVDGIMAQLKEVLFERLEVYLQTLVPRLLKLLLWRKSKNEYGHLEKGLTITDKACYFVLDSDIFRSLTPQPVINGAGKELKTPTQLESIAKPPLYCMSFICKQSLAIANDSSPVFSISRDKPQTKYDVRRGLTLDYLSEFAKTGPYRSDLFDTLQEYWYDWGGFGENIYRYHDLFPWDCSEAFGKGSAVCSGFQIKGVGVSVPCNLAKHVWAFPFDSWSIITLHLTKTRSDYPPAPGSSGQMSDLEWAQNRILLLTALEKLTTTASCMALNPRFHYATAWMNEINPMYSLTEKSEMHEEKFDDHVKLSGIHRAQPFGHATLYTGKPILAPWVHLSHNEKIFEYERIRYDKMHAHDVGLGVGNKTPVLPQNTGRRSRLGYSVGGEVESSRPALNGHKDGVLGEHGYSNLQLLTMMGGSPEAGCVPHGSNEYQDLPAIYVETPGEKALRRAGERNTSATTSSSGRDMHGSSGFQGSNTTSNSHDSTAWFGTSWYGIYNADAGGTGGGHCHSSGGGGSSSGGGYSGGSSSGGGGGMDSGGGGSSGGGGGGCDF